MKNNKGFTILEILIVITIILMMVLIIAPIVDKNIKDSEDLLSSSQTDLIEEAAYIYSITYKSEIPELNTTNMAVITLQTLLDKGLIEEKKIKANGDYIVPVTNVVVIVNVNGSIKTKYDINQLTKPLIILNGPNKTNIPVNTQYNELGAYVVTYSPNSVSELASSNISSSVNNTIEGNYTVEYTYTNAVTVVRDVTVSASNKVIDTEKPIITLIGLSSITITKGSTYTDQGATASDNIDGNITSRIVKTGTVNSKQKGIYYIKYNVTDKYGNKAATLTRKITVS